MRFAVVGGDDRFTRLCRLLGRDGHRVTACCLEGGGLKAQSPTPAALAGTECLILPLPAQRGPGLLNTPLSDGKHPVACVIGAVPAGTVVLAGKASEELRELAAGRGLPLVDYFEREDFTVRNAVATAEGALALLMDATDRTLWGMRVLVAGFGHIGKVLAHRLNALGADVTVVCRSRGDLAWCGAYGLRCGELSGLGSGSGGYDALINTIPVRVLGAIQLSELRPGATVIELASAPGGFDPALAEAMGLRPVSAPGLPGRVAPESAAEYIRDAVYASLRGEDGT